MSLILLIACGGGDEPATDTTWPGTDGPFLAPTEDEAAPALDLMGIGLALDAALASLLPMNAEAALRAYAELAASADGSCPDWYSSEGTPYWYDTCTTGDGTTFDGYASLSAYEGWDDGAGTVYDGYQFWGVATLTAASGRAFRAKGSASLLAGQGADGSLISYSYMDRGFYDSEAEVAWLDGSLEAGLGIWAQWSTSVGAAGIWLDGVLTGLSGEIEVLVLDGMWLAQEEAWGCEREPQASLSVLDDEGHWVDLVFDGAWGEPSCDGCGEAFVDGRAVGTVCTDFSPLVDWTYSPWW